MAPSTHWARCGRGRSGCSPPRPPSCSSASPPSPPHTDERTWSACEWDLGCRSGHVRGTLAGRPCASVRSCAAPCIDSRRLLPACPRPVPPRSGWPGFALRVWDVVDAETNTRFRVTASDNKLGASPSCQALNGNSCYHVGGSSNRVTPRYGYDPVGSPAEAEALASGMLEAMKVRWPPGSGAGPRGPSSAVGAGGAARGGVAPAGAGPPRGPPLSVALSAARGRLPLAAETRPC